MCSYLLISYSQYKHFKYIYIEIINSDAPIRNITDILINQYVLITDTNLIYFLVSDFVSMKMRNFSMYSEYRKGNQ